MIIGNSDYLAIYLNDHLGGATAGSQLARRSWASNKGTALGKFLDRLSDEIDADLESLREIMAALGVGEDRLKRLGGWSAEKLGRLKLNGNLLSPSPLSKLTELEGLYVGVAGKLSMWESLRASGDERLADVDLERLISRARDQLARIERQRAEVAAEVLAP